MHTLSIEPLAKSKDYVIVNHTLQVVVYRGTKEQCVLAKEQYYGGFFPEFERL